MSFIEKVASYRRLQQENKAWYLLRAENAPLILGFLGALFSDDRDVPIATARAILREYLKVSRDQFGFKSETDALNYLRTWVSAGQSPILFADGLGST